MIRLTGLIKILCVLAADFTAVYLLTRNIGIAVAITAGIAAYTVFGGYISIVKEGTIGISSLPEWQKNRIETAGSQLIEDIYSKEKIKPKFRFFLVPDSYELNATAYGAGCISITRGTLSNTDHVTLTAILRHEASHIVSLDAEFHRAVFRTVTIFIAGVGLVSYTVAVLIFLVFAVLGCSSWLSLLIFRGATKTTRGIFKAVQLTVIFLYKAIFSLISQHSEYRADSYSCALGYGVQLAQFLSVIGSDSDRHMTLADIMYRSHPPLERRIARVEKQIYDNKMIKQ